MTALLPDIRAGGVADGSLRCRERLQVTHDVASLVLEPDAPVSFDPGQYVTVTVDVGGQRLQRCYSISSPPTRPDSLAITVKRVPGGPVSGWLHDHVRPGDRLEVSGPYGVFSTAHHPSRRQLYLSAGSGITPLMSMARTVVDQQADADVVLVHHARTPADIVFRAELAQMSLLHQGIRTVAVCESDASDERWTGPRGRIGTEQLVALVPDLAEREVFVCGPAPYREAVRTILRDLGVDPGRVHEESYVLGETSTPSRLPAQAAQTARTYAVELRRSGLTLPCGPDEMLLDAVERAGVTLPSMCREGVCGTCKLQLLAGSVDMDHQGGIRPREVERDLVLPCCSVPRTDVVLDA